MDQNRNISNCSCIDSKMNLLTRRTPLLILFLLIGVCQSTDASQCRHIDRLVLADGNLTTWETSDDPVWEHFRVSSSSVRASDGHDEASHTGPVGVQPMIGIESTFGVLFDSSRPFYSPILFQSMIVMQCSPDPRPPRF